VRVPRITVSASAACLPLIAAFPGLAWAAGADTHAGFGPLLFGLAILVLVAKAAGLLAERWGQPAVLGELLAGIVLGNLLPPVLGGTLDAARSAPALQFLAELGVLILIFDVGLEADLRALARVGASSLLVATIGVAAPILLGWAAAAWLVPDSPRLTHLFVAATLSATSLGITARLLKDLRATRSAEGQIVLGAAILDDVLGLILLAVLSGLATSGGAGTLSTLTIVGIVARAALFLGLAAVLGHFLSGPIVRLAARTGHPETMLVIGLALCFSLAFVAEAIGLAAIVGAFAAGLMLDPYGQGVRARVEDVTLSELLHPLSTVFVPLFFVLMGARVDVAALASPAILALALALTACAIAGKLACGLGVLAPGANRLAVGIAMMPRGEVGLIFAGIGATLIVDGQPLLAPALFSAVVLMVLLTTLVAPVGLRWSLGRPRLDA